MKRFYSQSTGCTYIFGIHPVVPPDAVEISAERYDAVIANPAPGKVRAHDEQGLPYLVDAPVLLPDLEAQEREWRDSELMTATGMRDRHRDQVEIEVETTLTAEQFKELLLYMQALRDWPQAANFPNIQHRPTAPEWIAEQVE